MISQTIDLETKKNQIEMAYSQTDLLRGQRRNYADLIVDFLAALNVSYIFGVPGGAIDPFFSAIARRMRQSQGWCPRLVVARHEAGAAFMAEGYARETGQLGVCCATTGPGATNLITGLCSAYSEQLPILVLTAQTALPGFGKLAFQESSCHGIDTVGMFQHCTRYNSLVSHPGQLPHKMYQAIMSAFQHPRGPVHLSLPIDLMKMPVTETGGSLLNVPQRLASKTFDEAQVQTLLQTLFASRRAVLLLGSGCRNAIPSILALSEHFDLSIVTTPSGKGQVDVQHPRYRGVFGFAGHESAREALFDPEVDLILAVGIRLDEITTNAWDQRLFSKTMVHLDENPEEFLHYSGATQHILADLEILFERLLSSVRQNVNQGLPLKFEPKQKEKSLIRNLKPEPFEGSFSSERGLPSCVQGNLLKPQDLMRELPQRFPAHTRFLADAGNAWAWTIHYLHLKQEARYHIGMAYGAMAWGIGASIGVALGAPGIPVVCITGDGSFLMSGQELTVAVSEGLPVIFVILNDRALGMVQHGQRMSGAESIGCTLPPVDFAQMAKAMGAEAHTITSWKTWAQLDFEKMCTRRGPTLLDIHIDPEEVPPMGARVKALK